MFRVTDSSFTTVLGPDQRPLLFFPHDPPCASNPGSRHSGPRRGTAAAADRLAGTGIWEVFMTCVFPHGQTCASSS